jgi:phage baseplate assembly protein W|tara:strand:- start:134 stop:541 length:408 start_codon:yes stop_codon:yes gene_type:complete
MPIIKGIRRVNPLDLNKNVTIGVAFPLDETNMFSGTETIQEQSKANLINLLLTEPGERINLPNYGVGIKKLLFEQKINIDILKEKIQNQTAFYIPNITVLNVETSLSEEEETVFISISYKSNLDGSMDNIQLNFN